MITINRQTAAGLTTAAVLGMVATGCGSSGGTHASPSSRSVTPAARSLADEPGETILAKARAGLASAKSVRIKGTLSDKGERTDLDMRIGHGVGSGTMRVPYHGKPAFSELRAVDGRIYVRSPQLAKAAGGSAVAELLGNRWFYSSKGEASKPFEPFTDVAAFAAIVTTDGPFSKKGTSTVNGIPVVALADSGSVLYVATTGRPRPVRMAPTSGDGTEHLDFSEYDAPLNVTAPPDAFDIDHPKL